MDLSLSGTYTEVISGTSNPVQGDFDLKDLKSTMVFGIFNYGVSETWDLFFLLGASSERGDAKFSSSGSAVYIAKGEQFEYDSSTNIAWGLGTRLTLHESTDLSWGALGQITWYNPSKSSASWTNPNNATRTLQADLDLDFVEIQLAAGPTLTFDSVSVYGGPFLHFVDGDMSLSGTYTQGAIPTSGPIKGHFDVEQKSEIGLYLGTQWLATDNAYWYADAQFTGDAWGIGLGGLWRVE
jgi:hypothetical protein